MQRLPRPGSCNRRGQVATGWSVRWRWVHAACCSGVVPAAMAGSQVTRRVTTTRIQRSGAPAQAVRACWRASRFPSRVVRWVNRAAITGLFGSAAQTARQAAAGSRGRLRPEIEVLPWKPPEA
jgi:hypothetical protein